MLCLFAPAKHYSPRSQYFRNLQTWRQNALLAPKGIVCSGAVVQCSAAAMSGLSFQQWTERLDTLCLGRCSCTNQVSSVSLSVLCLRRMDISPVIQKKEGKKKPLVRYLWFKLYSHSISVSRCLQEKHEQRKDRAAHESTEFTDTGRGLTRSRLDLGLTVYHCG